MPYIKNERRSTAGWPTFQPENPGELNFSVTQLLTYYLENKGMSYTTCNDILGALEGAKLEFYRRVVVPYEDQKRHDNGDVYL